MPLREQTRHQLVTEEGNASLTLEVTDGYFAITLWARNEEDEDVEIGVSGPRQDLMVLLQAEGLKIEQPDLVDIVFKNGYMAALRDIDDRFRMVGNEQRIGARKLRTTIADLETEFEAQYEPES